MSKLDIKIYPDKVLKRKAAPIKKVDEKVRTLAGDMIDTMKLAKGIGLAAPQVGISKRLIVIEAMENMKNNEPLLVLINPKILKRSGCSSLCEGCLSIPEVTLDVVRPEWVIIEAIDLEAKPIKIETGGLLARVIQHEIDHLEGILFIDRVSFWKRRRLTKRLSPKVCVEL